MGEVKIDRRADRGIASVDNQKGRSRGARHDRTRPLVGSAGGAEGVEDADTYEALSSLGCDLAQGYFLCEPKSADHALFPSPGSCPRNVRDLRSPDRLADRGIPDVALGDI